MLTFAGVYIGSNGVFWPCHGNRVNRMDVGSARCIMHSLASIVTFVWYKIWWWTRCSEHST